MVNCVGCGQFVKMLDNSSYVDNLDSSYVDIFDEAFDKQHFDQLHFNQQQQHFDVIVEMGKARKDVEEMASLNQPG